jgi:hypothetical protein
LFLLTVSASIRIHQAPAWQNHYRDGSPEQQLKNRPRMNRPETTGLRQTRLILLITRVIVRVKWESGLFFADFVLAPIRRAVAGNHHWMIKRLEDLWAGTSCGMTPM